MKRNYPKTRLPGTTYAVSNTGPLISAFQSDSFHLLTQVFAEIWISSACAAELEKHGWGEEIQTAQPALVVVELTADEHKRALKVARQIAENTDSHDPVAENHLGEAQAIVLAQRPEHKNDLLLLDELAARSVAKQLGLKLSGFPGVLLLATQGGLITAKELRTRLEKCRAEGTHYGTAFIQQVYEMARRHRRQKK